MIKTVTATAIRVLEGIKADNIFQPIVKKMTKEETVSYCLNMTLSFPAIAYSIQAIKAHDANDQENAWYYAAQASYWHGVVIAMKGGREAISSMARKGADARHKENRSLKQEAINYYLDNHQLFSIATAL